MAKTRAPQKQGTAKKQEKHNTLNALQIIDALKADAAQLQAKVEAERDALLAENAKLRKAAGSDMVLPFPDLPPDAHLTRGKDVTLSLSGTRRRKLHAMLNGLRKNKATFLHTRGARSAEMLVSNFADVFYWMVDNVMLSDRK